MQAIAATAFVQFPSNQANLVPEALGRAERPYGHRL